MKKFLKIILISLSVVIAILALAWGGMFLKMSFELKAFTPIETGRVVDNIFVVKDDFANVFILQDSAQYVVIDCANNSATVSAQMEKLGISPDKVTAVFLTHTDDDHVGALNLFDKAKLYMSSEEEQMINGKRAKFLWFGNSLSRTDYILLNDREIVKIGNLKFETFLAPGHTSGMTAYLVNNKYLFTGDIASLKNGKIAPIPAFFDMDTEMAVKSHEVIRRIPTAEYIFTGHWGYTDDYQRAVKNDV